MHKTRLEAFSDGVIAILITIMVLELKVPQGDTAAAIAPIFPLLGCYLMSFIFLGIYWNNHHHLFQAVKEVTGSILWANLHLLFWLSLVPFVTRWMGESHFTLVPVAAYGFNLLAAGTAYYILAQALIRHHGPASVIARAIGKDRKGVASIVIYSVAIGCAFLNTRISLMLYALVALIWLIPDPRIEKHHES